MKEGTAMIPQMMKEYPHWICWARAIRDGKETKLPQSPHGGFARADDQSTWGTFNQAQTYLQQNEKLSGLGFVFSDDDDFCGIDLDSCRDAETGKIDNSAQDIINAFNSYTEISPSKEGIHIIISGKKKGTKARKGKIEIYDRRRYFTMTGDVLGDHTTIEHRQEQLDKLYDDLFITEQSEQAQPQMKPDDDSALIEKAKSATNGAKFTALWSGDTSGHASHSEADLALCSMLAYWTGCDAGAIDRLFRQSGLVRDKWTEREDYRTSTIEQAISAGNTTFSPGGQVEQPTAYVYEPIDTSEIDLTPSLSVPVLPESVWRGTFAKYRQLMSPASEAPDAYHFGNLLTCIGALLGRSVMVHYAEELYPNFYAVLEGPTGISRKSSATRKAVMTIRDVDPTLIVRRGLSTIEGMINLLKAPTEEEIQEYTDKLTAFNKGLLTSEPEKPTPIFEHEGRRLLIQLDEFTQLLKKARQESSSTLIYGLTSAYDMPETLDNPTKENPMSAHKPCVSVIGLTTKAWLEHALNYEDLLGGFVNRFIFFAGEPKDPIPFPPKPDKKLWEGIMAFLQTVRYLHHHHSEKQRSSHEFTLTDEAMDVWDKYYRDWHKRQRESSNDMMTALYQRLPNHAMKTALVYAVLEYDDGADKITGEQIRASIDFANYAEEVYTYLFRGFGFSQRSRIEATIEDKLREKAMTRRDLSRFISSAISSHDLTNAIDDMIRIGKVSEIQRQEKATNGKTYSKKLLVLLK